VSIGFCVACLEDTDCGPADEFSTGTCDPVFYSCEGCDTDAQCAQLDPSRPYCDERHCHECRTDADCQPVGEDSTGRCTDGRCRGCDSDMDCRALDPPVGVTGYVCR
jgi:hypothetical protein